MTDAPKLDSGLDKMRLEIRCGILWRWLDRVRYWFNGSQSWGEIVFRMINYGLKHWIKERLERMEKSGAVDYGFDQIWPGDARTHAMHEWLSGAQLYILAALEGDPSLSDYSDSALGLELNPYQSIVAIFGSVISMYGFSSFAELKTAFGRIQRPLGFVENCNGAEFHKNFLEWKSFKNFYNVFAQDALDGIPGLAVAGWTAYNPMLVIDSLVDIANFIEPHLNRLESKKLFDFIDSSNAGTFQPSALCEVGLVERLLALFRNSGGLKKYKKPAGPAKAHPTIQLGKGQPGKGTHGKGSSGKGGKDGKNPQHGQQQQQQQGKGKTLTPYCKKFQTGNCTFPNCKFLHEIQPLCRHFANGTCKFGDQCVFKHEKPNDAPPQAAAAAQQPTDRPKGPKGYCWDFLAGKCTNKDCKFKHEQPGNV